MNCTVEKEQTNLTLRKDIKERAIKAIDKGLFSGINSLSSLVEIALVEKLDATKGA